MLKSDFSNFLEADYFSVEQRMERVCQGITLPKHAFRSPEFLGRELKVELGVALAGISRWGEGRAGQKDMRKERARRAGQRGKSCPFLTHTHFLLPTIILSYPQVAGNGVG